MTTVEPDFDDLFGEGFQLNDRLAKTLRSQLATPEGRVRAAWVARLIREYGFHQNQIAINVAAGAGRAAERSAVFADIVVYRDAKRQEPFIVIETKPPGDRSGIKQAESYARNLGADYHGRVNGNETAFYRTAKYTGQSTEVGNIPHWLGNAPQSARLSKSYELPPFRDEPHLREVVKVCHDRIFYRLGHDPAKAFDELMKLLFLKLYDERETPECYEFMVLADEAPAETARRINQLFGKSIASRRYKDVFSTRFSELHPPVIDLDDETIAYIVRQFQGYGLVTTSAILQGADVKGTVFEKMVGGTFRGELGAYFTPREIVEFMVKMMNPTRDDIVLDPACGSGGFLIMTLKYVLERMRRSNPNLKDADIYAELRSFAERNLFGVDLNERMARVSKMNMIMHGDGHGGIFNLHGLEVGYAAQAKIRLGQDVTCIFSNPPFAGREADPDQLKKFEVTKSEAGRFVSTHKTLPFVEHIISLLADGGRAALVLPSGVFSSQSYQFRKLREIIWTKTEIIAVIGLPHWVFFHTGCDVQGALLFLKRTDTPRDNYNIFIDWAENVGYDTAGKKTGKSDFDDILQKFQARRKANLFSAARLKERGRIDPLYYQPGEHQKASLSREGRVPLTELCVPTKEFVQRRNNNDTVVQYLEVGDTDKETGAILSTTPFPVSELPSRAKYVVRENMLLIPNHRNSIKAKRSVVLVTSEYDGLIVTSRFIAVRTLVPAEYLYQVLNLDFVKEKMLTLVSGSSSTEVKFDQLAEILVPMPSEGDFELFLERLRDMREEVAAARENLAAKLGVLDSRIRELYAA